MGTLPKPPAGSLIPFNTNVATAPECAEHPPDG
jgi:hypothetical protein